MTTGTDLFIPLAVGPAAKGKMEEFHLLVAAHPEKARRLSDSNLAGIGVAAGSAVPVGCEPRITVQKEGECITGIHIQCSCGQVIDLKCAYSK
jgi:hypothetical protein